MPLKTYSQRSAKAADILPDFPHFSMTDSAEQPLLEEQAGATKKPAKKRTTKPAASVTKASKPAAAKKPAAKKSAVKRVSKKASAKESQPDLPVQPAVEEEIQAAAEAAIPAAPAAPAAPVKRPEVVATAAAKADRIAAPTAGHAIEEWSPSAGRSETPVTPAPSQPAVQATPIAANGVAGSDAPHAESAPPAPPVIKQRPVYIPRHIAKQMEEQARLAGEDPGPIPVSMPASEAPRIQQFERAERTERAERMDRGDRGDRMDRGDRGDRSDRNDRNDRQETPRVELPPREEELGEVEGIVEVSGKGFGFLRDPKRGFAQHPNDVFVTPELCRSHNLRDGQWVKGQTRRGNRGSQLYRLISLNDDDPAKAQHLPVFDELTVISPLERIQMETVPERYTTRVIDMLTPIGKGQRGLIVAPPRTGKTTLLQHIGDALVKNHKDIKLIILLVDERPEEVTEIKRTVPTAEIMASSNDSDIKSHTRIAQLAIERAKRLVESGRDVFILLDSITRVGRAFNNATSGGGRTGSGGLDTRALEIPRKIFAAARNTEEAGSLTIIATALIETGSRMDEVIFQEFKGTGNMELVLDRKLSDMRIYPAVDIFQSGTRREELLIPADDLHKINVIRRGLAGHKPIEAMERLLFFLKKFPTNSQMLAGIPG
jgi:transcription termination factor Rho